MKKIVSHKEPRHMDDFLALCLAKFLYPNAEIEYVSPQEVPKEYLEDNEVLVIDVGMKYEETKNNFDHHSDTKIPCSFFLIYRHLLKSEPIGDLFQAVDIIDRLGPKYLPLTEEERVFWQIIPLYNPEIVYQTVANFILGRNISSKSILDALVELNETIRKNHPDEAKRVDTLLLETQKNLQKYLENLEIYEKFNLKIGISKINANKLQGKIFEITHLDILIEPNSFNSNHTSLIVNSLSPKKEKAYDFADSLAKNFEIVFTHPNRFIRVINAPIDKISEVFLYLENYL